MAAIDEVPPCRMDNGESCSDGEAQHRGVDRKADLPAPEEDCDQHELQRLLDERSRIAHQRGGRQVQRGVDCIRDWNREQRGRCAAADRGSDSSALHQLEAVEQDQQPQEEDDGYEGDKCGEHGQRLSAAA